MSDTKIQSIVPQGSYKTKDGTTMYKFDVILENGMVGEVGARTQDKWEVGDRVVVTKHVNTNWGPRLSLDRHRSDYGEDQARAKFATPQPDGTLDRQESIVRQWAIRESISWLTSTTIKPDALTLYDVWGVAKHIKSMHDDFDTWGGAWKKQQAHEDQKKAIENCPPIPEAAPPVGDEDLPF